MRTDRSGPPTVAFSGAYCSRYDGFTPDSLSTWVIQSRADDERPRSFPQDNRAVPRIARDDSEKKCDSRRTFLTRNRQGTTHDSTKPKLQFAGTGRPNHSDQGDRGRKRRLERARSRRARRNG